MQAVFRQLFPSQLLRKYNKSSKINPNHATGVRNITFRSSDYLGAANVAQPSRHSTPKATADGMYTTDVRKREVFVHKVISGRTCYWRNCANLSQKLRFTKTGR